MSDKEQKKLKICEECKGNGYRRAVIEEGREEIITDCKPCNNQGEILDGQRK